MLPPKNLYIMKNFKTISEATAAAELFFKENFGYEKGVGVDSAEYATVRFYSKNDPGMADTFDAQIEDGVNRFCVNGGELVSTKTKIAYAASWDNGKEQRYIDDENSIHGTSLEENARIFDTKEEAQNFIDNNDLENCSVIKIEVLE